MKNFIKIKNKTVAIVLISLGIIFISGCGDKKIREKKVETINPFSPTSMVNTYNRSKIKINNSVEKENNHLRKTLDDSGVQ